MIPFYSLSPFINVEEHHLNAFFSTLIAPILTHRHGKFAFLFGIYANNIKCLREKDVNRQRSFSARG